MPIISTFLDLLQCLADRTQASLLAELEDEAMMGENDGSDDDDDDDDDDDEFADIMVSKNISKLVYYINKTTYDIKKLPESG